MEITVKRRTWLLGWLMPIDIKFNRKTIGSVGGNQTKSLEISEETGTLTYDVPLIRTDKIQVEADDVILIKETVLGKILNIIFFTTILFFILNSVNTYITGYPYESNIFRILGIGLIIVLIGGAVISLFFNSYKFVIED